jgi:uncharacterized protein YndB with AHSA1/START domain
MANPNSSTTDRELFLTRTVKAPIELVWEVWTKPEHICNWWGPNDFTCTISKMDFRTGGEWNLILHGPDGRDYDNRSRFLEIIPFKKIIYDHVSEPHIIATIEFEDLGEETLIKWHMLFDSHEMLVKIAKEHKAEEGQKQNIEKLSAYIKSLNR